MQASSARLRGELLAASFAVLFQELTLIRWLPGQVRVLAYFPNLILISAFLGLGIGCLRAGRRSLLWLWPASLLVAVLVAKALSGVVFTQNSPTEHLFLLYYDLPPGSPVVRDVRLPIIGFFLLSAISFVSLGQIVAERLEEFRRRSSALWGYCWDIAGSLGGVAAFTSASLFGLFPVIWFTLLLLVGSAFFAVSSRRWLAFACTSALIVLVVNGAERADRYSPYYALRVVPAAVPDGIAILTNGSVHQYAFDPLSRDTLPEIFEQARIGYSRPYPMMNRPPRRALVFGSGTGNDVAVLLGQGVEQIDAVEIDPVILDIGQALHPAHPYRSPRVRIVNTDARSFLENSRDSYDLIIFATLDSMTQLSALSNVRLDNFVYTLDCIRAARRHLTSTGGIAMYFMVGADYIDERLAGMLAEAFGQLPMVIRGKFHLFNRIYLAGPGFDGAGGPERTRLAAEMRQAGTGAAALPSDDWPFLYLAKRGLSGFYLTIMVLVAACAVSAVFAASPELRASPSDVDWEMFLFGLGFLLLETRAVTAMNLLWGATWLTSAVVFASILATVLLATLWVQLHPISFGASSSALCASLLGVYLLPTHVLLVPSLSLRLCLSAMVVGLPIFFASACFAVLFRMRAAPSTAFGWNLLGAVAGGLLELTSMALGLKALLLVAAVAYLLAAFVWLREPQPAAASAGA